MKDDTGKKVVVLFFTLSDVEMGTPGCLVVLLLQLNNIKMPIAMITNLFMNQKYRESFWKQKSKE